MKRKKLLEEFKNMTLEQLQAVQEENPARFLERVEKCERIIVLLDELDRQKDTPFLKDEEQEIEEVLQDIMRIRERISPLLAPLRDKLKQQMMMEKRKERASYAYSGEDDVYPSIFFDKKN